ncbi:MAG TPA: TatD family hydrolase [Hyphomicrobiaceae bacterium]|nr:TatD family hydrolase [Hyphomicrobiaceae bacterium]
MLVDHHCHLDFPDLAADREGVLARARAAGVGAMITISTRVRRFAEITAIAEAHSEVYCSVGTHPHYAHEEPDLTPEQLAGLARHPKCVAIGEAGLDYFYQKSPREAQADGFRRHIAAARLSALPLVIHSRDADADTIAILEDEMSSGRFAAVLHCFTGGRELAFRAVELGLYVSFSGVITFSKSEALREIAAALPLDRLLVETDAPYLAPAPHRGKRNEPAFVAHTAAALAKVRGMPVAALAMATTENALRLYAKIPRVALGLTGAAA